MDSLETIVEQLNQKPVFQEPQKPVFNESHDGFEMSVSSFTRVSGSLPVIAIGVILSSTVGGYLQRWLGNFAEWSAVIAGALIMYFGKRNAMLKDFGAGVLIGGLAAKFSNLASSFGEPMSPAFEESRVTFGGVDGGMMVTSPDRRVMT